MNPLRKFYLPILLFIISLSLTTPAFAQVPLRISIKFILDASGNRPATGNLNTDAEINTEFTSAINILARAYTEFSVDRIEFVDLSGLSQWYSTSAATTTGRDQLRTAAIAAPATYHWRTDAINIYINGGTSSAISDFPPNNNIILMNQWCGNTPSCILHEMGHSLNLMHTHEPCCTNQDACADTITDNSGWTKDQLAQNNYGCLYASCTASQKNAVDLVYNNVMSYHTDEPQLRLSPCQMDRISSQAYGDRNWIASKIPVYVNKYVAGTSGTFASPYMTLQGALNAGGLDNRVLVLQQGTYTTSQELINFNQLDIVTRSGPSSFSLPGVQKYILPVELENSKNPGVSNAIKSVQNEDRSARNVDKTAAIAEANAVKAEEKAAIRADANSRAKIHHDNAIKGLLGAEQFAENNEKLAIQLELAQRYRDAGDCDNAIRFFKKVAEATDQPGLKEEALSQIGRCGNKKSNIGK